MNNYLKLHKFSFIFDYYCYIDVQNYRADNIFVRNNCRVLFWKEYRRKDTDYVVIICKVLKKDSDLFIKSMSELSRNMILLGYKNYSEFCEELFVHGRCVL